MNTEDIKHIKQSIKGQEYLYIKCTRCNERVKLAQNKGSDWMTYNFLYDFALEHFAYDHKPEDIVLEWER